MQARAEALHHSVAALELRFAGALRLGLSPRPLDPPLFSLPPFSTAVQGQPLQIGGVFPFFFAPARAGGPWALLLSPYEAQSPLTAYLLHLVLAAAAAPEHVPLRGPCFVVEFDWGPEAKGGGTIHRLPSFPRDEATRHLRELLEDLRRAPDFDLLSLDAVREIRERAAAPGPEATVNWKARLEEYEREQREPGFFAPKRHSRLLRAVDPEIPGDAQAKIQRRLLPFLLWRAQWETWTPEQEET